MKKISLFILVILSSLFICLGCVNAATNSPYYGYDIQYMPKSTAFQNWTSSSAMSLVNPTVTTTYEDSTRTYVYVTSAGIASNGYAVNTLDDTRLVAGYLYGITGYFCSGFSYSTLSVTFSNVSSQSGNASSYSHTYVYNGFSSLTNAPYSDTLFSSYANYCWQVTTLIVPSSAVGNWLSWKFTSSTSVSGYFVFLGYDITPMGLYTDTIKSMISSSISSSGLASASSIDEVQDSIADIESDIASVNSSINSLSDSVDSYNETLDNGINSESDDVESSSCGIICKLKAVVQGIAELPSKLVNLLIDALKSLFVPTDEQLYELIESSQDLAENFGFVGEAVSFFISIFTSLLGLINGNGCIDLPEFSIGATSLFDSFTFWEAQYVCLADNVVLADNIDTIRVVTSIGLVGLFLGFASSQFFSILSKETKDTDNSESEDKE